MVAVHEHVEKCVRRPALTGGLLGDLQQLLLAICRCIVSCVMLFDMLADGERRLTELKSLCSGKIKTNDCKV